MRVKTNYHSPLCVNYHSICVDFLIACILIIAMLSFALGGSESPTLQFNHTYGPYSSYDVIQTPDGGYAIACQNATLGSHGYNNYEPSVIKTDSNGQLQWRTVISEFGWAASVAKTKDSGFIVGCNPNGALIKLDGNGNIQWEKTFGLTSCYVIQTNDGGYILAGSEQNANNGYNIRLIKTDENGNLLWNKTLNFGFVTLVTSFIETTDNGYAFSGQTDWFAKTDANGNLLWNQTYNLPAIGESIDVNSIANTNDGGYVLAGFTGNGAGAFLIKTDMQGNVQWSDIYSKSSYKSISQANDGGYIAAGVDQSGSYALIKMDIHGKITWNVSVSGNPSSIILSNDNSYVVTGTVSTSGSVSSNIFLAKYSAESGVNPSPSVPESLLIVVSLPVVVTVLTLIFLRKKKLKKMQWNCDPET